MPLTSYALSNHKKLGILPSRLEHLESRMIGWIDDKSSQAINISILKNGREIFSGSYGRITPDGNNLKIDDLFPIASITKPVVAALLLQLQEDGDIDLFRPVADFLPEFGANGKEEICIHHLLSHTSGLDEEKFFSTAKTFAAKKLDMVAPDEKNCTWEEINKFYSDMCQKIGLDCSGHDGYEKLAYFLPAQCEAGTLFSYNTFGYDAALKIALKITGESADSLASRRVFVPLGMTDSHFILPNEKHNRIVQRGEGYMGYPWMNSCHNWENGGSGLKSTTSDILKFMEMVRLKGAFNGKRILSPLSAQLMTENHNRQLDSFSSWTIGFNCYGGKLNDTGMMRSAHTVDHGGAMQSYVRADMANRLTFAYFSVMKNQTPLRRPLVANMVMSALAL